MVKILSLHIGHDASVMYMDNQSLIGLSEERVSRIKNFNGFPKKAIDFILDIFRENEKNPPEKYLCRKDIVDILHVDFKVPESTGYRYHSEAEKEYMWEK